MIKVYTGLHVKYRLFLSEFTETWISSEYFPKMLRLSNVTKIRLLGAEFLNAGGRTGGETYMTKLIVDFRDFATCLRRNKFYV